MAQEKKSAEALIDDVGGEIPPIANEKTEDLSPLVEVPAKLAEVPPLQASRLTPAESLRTQYVVIVNHGVTVEHLLKTSFWQHHTKSLRRGDELRVECEDGSWVAWIYVQAIGPKDVKVRLLQSLDLDPMDPEALSIPNDHDVKYRGLIDKWTVLRKTEKGMDVLKSGFESRSAAIRWMGAHVMSMSR